MSQQHPPEARVTVDIENIGGIDQRTLEFDPGVTVLIGENATNRTSMLRSIMAACGSDRAYLKADADEGHVTLNIGDTTYTRRFERRNDGVTTDGSPLLTDAHRIKAADYFAFLLADNQARLSVLDPEADLRDIVMAPVDTGAIEEEIEQLQDELQAVTEAIDRRETLQNEKLPGLEADREELQDKLEDLEVQLAETEAELEEADEDVETSKEQQERIDLLTSDLGDAREERDRFDSRIQDEEGALTEARSEYETVQKELDALSVPDEAGRDAIENELNDLRDQREKLNEVINTLTTIIAFNEERLTGDSTVSDAVETALNEPMESEKGSGQTAEDLTRQLTEPAASEETIRCWTCGQQAATSQIEETIESLREEVQARRTTRAEIEDEIDKLETELNTFREKQREQQRLEKRAASIEDSIEETEDRIASLKEQREHAANRVTELEDKLAELETDDEAYSRVIELHSKITELETKLTQKEDQLSEKKDEIKSIQEVITELTGVEEQRGELEAELENKKRRIESLQEEVVEAFNEHMDTLLEKLAYENIERVWLERRQEEVQHGRRKVEETVFDLHVVRETPDGTVFEDTPGIQHLSESERNIVGLVFALVGYLAHDVYEDVPFMLLDSLEAMDAERIATVVEYFSRHTDYLVASLLPETQEPLLTTVDPETVDRVNSTEG